MVSFSTLDYIIVAAVFIGMILIGVISALKKNKNADEYLLSGRKIGLVLFIITNVSTWYGGILGVGEYSYRYGISSWFTQGFPYYIFATLFALLFAEKIRDTSFYTIPDKLESVYGSTVKYIASILVFLLVSPAPYLLMTAVMIKLIIGIPLIYALLLISIPLAVYILIGGFKTNVYADIYLFILMFLGFAIGLYVLISDYGGYNYLVKALPAEKLQITGGASPVYLLVWFLIALWTFADPGFHQRTYSAKSKKTAKYGIIISIFFWFLFDILTNTTGLYSAAILKDIDNPVMSFPLLAEKAFSSGIKGLFFAAMFATVLSTLNSFMFLSATTVSKDIFGTKHDLENIDKLKLKTAFGMVVTVIFSVTISMLIPSVIEMWFLIGSICIPGMILLIVGAYYPKYNIPPVVAVIEVLVAPSVALIWYIIKSYLPQESSVQVIEPMIVGLAFAIIIHIIGVTLRKKDISL